MSGCIRTLYDYNPVKRCSRGTTMRLKSNFHEQSASNDR